jgi:hypothetical protein
LLLIRDDWDFSLTFNEASETQPIACPVIPAKAEILMVRFILHWKLLLQLLPR